jgi:hypothetical protein
MLAAAHPGVLTDTAGTGNGMGLCANAVDQTLILPVILLQIHKLPGCGHHY